MPEPRGRREGQIAGVEVMKPTATRENAFYHCTLPLAFLLLFSLGPPPCSGSIGEAANVAAASAPCAWRSTGEYCSQGTKAPEPEMHGRSLQQAQRRYISYDSLRRDAVPCSRLGASYYNCRAPPGSNTHSRGCLTITRCARDDSP